MGDGRRQEFHCQSISPFHEHRQDGRRRFRQGSGANEISRGIRTKAVAKVPLAFRNITISPGRPIMNIVLWIIQVLLALLFLFAGVTKLVLPIEEMTKQMAMPGLFLRFLGVVEVLGALGLILPGLLRIKPGLTPLAAALLVIVMIGAVVISLKMAVSAALIPLVTGGLLVFVAYG